MVNDDDLSRVRVLKGKIARKTPYLMNDPNIVGATMTLERMVADTEEMINWVRKELGKNKIFLLGHSWGIRQERIRTDLFARRRAVRQ
jgi:hypothetical protein